MNKYTYIADEQLWGPEKWESLELNYKNKISNAVSEDKAYNFGKELGNKILKNYSSSFFTVTRFLPKYKRDLVEIIYAAVRYPDEIVDTFNFSDKQKEDLLNTWENKFKLSSDYSGLIESVNNKIPVILSCFRKLSVEKSIPDKYYFSFLEAMKKDISKKFYKNMDDLINNYIYGSAIVVGYFLAYIYGGTKDHSVKDLLQPSKELGIALQLTNFARDVYEDYFRGRFYTPINLLDLPKNEKELEGYVINARKILAVEAENWYLKAEKGMEFFAKDSQIAIKSCLNLYRKLNEKIIYEKMPVNHRYSLSLKEKFSFIPLSKIWKLFVIYLK